MTDLALVLSGGWRFGRPGWLAPRRDGGFGPQKRAPGEQQPRGAEEADAQYVAPGHGQAQRHAQ